MRFILGSLFVVLAVSSFGLAATSSASSGVKIGSIYVDDVMPQEEVHILETDYKAFKNFPLDLSQGTELKRIIGSHSPQGPTTHELDQWLTRWIHFIVPSPFRDSERIQMKPHRYPIHAQSADNFFMVNYGLMKYLGGRSISNLMSMLFIHDKIIYKFPIHSPALGVIRVDADYFDDEEYIGFNPDIIPDAQSIVRFSTWVHEAAHSRGQGPFTGFPHIHCPDTVEHYARQLACDSSNNGGNGSKAAFLTAVLEACQEIRHQNIEDAPSFCQHPESLSYIELHRDRARERILSNEAWDETPLEELHFDTLPKTAEIGKLHH